MDEVLLLLTVEVVALLVANAYYYNCFTALCPVLPRWIGTRRLNHSGFYWSRDDGLAVASTEPYPRHLHLRSRQMTMPALHHSAFYWPDAFPAAQPTESKHWRHAFANAYMLYLQSVVESDDGTCWSEELHRGAEQASHVSAAAASANLSSALLLHCLLMMCVHFYCTIFLLFLSNWSTFHGKHSWQLSLIHIDAADE